MNTRHLVTAICSVSILVLGSICSMAQSHNGWELINPLPTGDHIKIVAFVDESLGYIGSDNYAFRTTNGGETWEEVDEIAGINAISFFGNTGYVVPSYNPMGIVKHTTDGGYTWTNSNLEEVGSYRSVQAISESSTIFTTSQQIVYTTNNGWDWSYRYLPFCCPTASHFWDDLSGIIGTSEGMIYKTTDAGLSWQNTFDGSSSWGLAFIDIAFVNATIGFAVSANSDDLYKTTDGGDTWNAVDVGITVQAFDIQFLNENLGFLCASYGRVFKTTDAGVSWTEISPEILFSGNANLYAIHAFDESTVISVGNLGRILKTTDGGINWDNNSNLLRGIRDISFVNDSVGYVNGHFDIYKTTNGGFDWEMVRDHVANDPPPTFITFFNEDVGLIACAGQSYGRYYKTTNGGDSWTQITQPNTNYDNISALSFNADGVLFTSTSYDTPTYSKTYKSLDLGTTWIEIYDEPIFRLTFVSAQVMYGLKTFDGARIVVKSVDGGTNWTEILDLDGQYILSYHFPSPDVGYLISRVDFYITNLYKTTDGGNSWSIDLLPNDFDERNFNQMIFTDENQGYVMDNNGVVFQTSDGGENWSSLHGTFGGIKMYEHGNYLYVGGTHGKLWRRSLPMPVNLSNLDSTADNLMIYPNPARDYLQINHVSDVSGLAYAIYSVSGKRLYEGVFSQSIQTIDLRSFPAGVYVLRVDGGETKAVRFVKM